MTFFCATLSVLGVVQDSGLIHRAPAAEGRKKRGEFTVSITVRFHQDSVPYHCGVPGVPGRYDLSQPKSSAGPHGKGYPWSTGRAGTGSACCLLCTPVV